VLLLAGYESDIDVTFFIIESPKKKFAEDTKYLLVTGAVILNHSQFNAHLMRQYNTFFQSYTAAVSI
jgi:hypothetical protein